MEKLINIAGLLEECKQYTKLYSVTHGDVLKKHRHYSLTRKKFVYYFCPFDKVLVRQDRNKEWVADWFSHITSTEPEERIYVTVRGKCWAYCIPFDKSTADLVGSASDFEENE